MVATRVRGGVQLREERAGAFTVAKERRFLEALACSGNVSAALRAAGVSSTALYNRRRRVPSFQGAWDAALNEGYSKLEADLLARALGNDDGREGAERTELVKMPDAVKLALLKAHGARVAAVRATLVERAEDIETLRARIIARLDRLAMKLDVEPVR